MGQNPKTEQVTAWSTSMVLIAGSAVVPTGPSLNTVNLQINPVVLGTPPNPGASTFASYLSLAPASMRGGIYLNPNGSVAPAAANTLALPRGMAAGATGTLGSELLVDLSAYNSDVIYADAEYRANARGAQAKSAYVSAVDNVNKLVYIQVQNQAGTATTVAAGETINFYVVVKESAGL